MTARLDRAWSVGPFGLSFAAWLAAPNGWAGPASPTPKAACVRR